MDFDSVRDGRSRPSGRNLMTISTVPAESSDAPHLPDGPIENQVPIMPETAAASFDFAIIGGGIVGLATALALTRQRPGIRLVVLEKENRLAAHQTGHNSGVIHSGIYYKPGSSKAKHCVAGRDALYRFCSEHGVAHERCGKIIVATEPGEIPALEELERRGSINGLHNLRRLSPDEVRELEPHVACLDALHVPETGIVDFRAMAEVCARLLRVSHAEIHFKAGLKAARPDGRRLLLETDAGEFRVRGLINCAGLQADRVARLCGAQPDLRILPFRGEYYELTESSRDLVNNLIYPVPDPRFPFLGVHFTRMIHGGVEAGPNAVLAMDREGYRRNAFSLGDAGEILRYRGFWRMAARHWRMGLGELHRSWSRDAYVDALRKLIPEIKNDDVRPAGCGVRAQGVLPDGTLVDDFHILQTERMVHVLNAPSPAATASLAIGESIAAMALRNILS